MNAYNKESVVLSIILLIISIIGLTIIVIISNKGNEKSIPYRVNPHLLVHPGGVSDII